MIRIMISRFVVITLLVFSFDAQLVASQLAPYFGSLHNNDPSFTTVLVAIGVTTLFVFFFAFYLRNCADSNLNIIGPPVPSTATVVNYSTSRREPQGIDPKLLDKFPTLMYSNHKKNLIRLGGSVPLDCVVCLTEFEHDDMLRLFPKCNHVFHPDCIKKWLASNVTCPVCRAVLKPEEEVAVVIRNEASEPPEEEVGDRSATWVVATRMAGVSCGERGLRRSHSTGHSLDLRSMRDDVFEGRQDEGSSRGRTLVSGNVSASY
ncbi:hypothetical protein K1719_028311 [Acacia pycnantha]|nr:hypothetical protein K1719_028311 [Acacia pycnantha]